MSKSGPGNFFEDFALGWEIRHATPRTVTAGDVALYTALYGSRFALHASDEFARGLGYHHPINARTLWIDDKRAIHDLRAEDPAHDEFPQSLDLAAIEHWIDQGKVRFEDHNESNYSVLLSRKRWVK